MIGVKQAVNNALKYFQDLYEQDLLNKKLSDLRLEEVELSDDEKYWFVTIGYTRALPDDSPLANILPAPIPKTTTPIEEYKIFKIDSTSGTVRAMKIREPLAQL